MTRNWKAAARTRRMRARSATTFASRTGFPKRVDLDFAVPVPDTSAADHVGHARRPAWGDARRLDVTRASSNTTIGVRAALDPTPDYDGGFGVVTSTMAYAHGPRPCRRCSAAVTGSPVSNSAPTTSAMSNHSEPRGTRNVAASRPVPTTTAAAATTRRRQRAAGPSTVAGSQDETSRSGTRTDLGGRPTSHPCRQGLGCGLGEHHRRVAQQLIEPVIAHHDLVRQ